MELMTVSYLVVDDDRSILNSKNVPELDAYDVTTLDWIEEFVDFDHLLDMT